MIDALIDTLDHGIRVFMLLVGEQRFAAIALGLILSGGSTQFLKAIPRLIASQNRELYTQLWSVATAFVPTFLLNPAPMTERLITALAVAFASPVLYKILVSFLPAGAKINLSGDPSTMAVREP